MAKGARDGFTLRGDTGGTGPEAFPKKMQMPRRPREARLSSHVFFPMPSITHFTPERGVQVSPMDAASPRGVADPETFTVEPNLAGGRGHVLIKLMPCRHRNRGH